jgi:ribosomal protein S18 acetylase RimI-like enzyme
MNLHLKQGYYQDIRACEEIARDSVLYERYFANDYRTEDYVRAYFPDDGKGRLYFAETSKGEKAGLMVISRNGFTNEYHYLALLCVKKEFRGQGVGAWLLEQFEQMGREDGRRKASLTVSDFNVRAFEFYKANGYYEVGIIPSHIMSTAVQTLPSRAHSFGILYSISKADIRNPSLQLC